MSNTEAIQRQAQDNHRNNPQTPKASEQDISNAIDRNTYNAEIERQRQSR
ncbi:MAG: hypothetical protein K8F62_17890 [Pseudorhodoplanes sp.]|nr:hypothetical protein [Pseudorhodoplanes sp.]